MQEITGELQRKVKQGVERGEMGLGNHNAAGHFTARCCLSLLSALRLFTLHIFPPVPLPRGQHCGSSGCSRKAVLTRGQEKDLGQYLAPWLWVKLIKTS